VISNTVGSGDTELTEALDKAGIRPLIDALVTSRDFGKAKPDPAIYAKVPAGSASARRDGDGRRPVGHGHRGALNAGIPGIWLRHPGAIAIPGIAPPHHRRPGRITGLLDATYVPDRR